MSANVYVYVAIGDEVAVQPSLTPGDHLVDIGGVVLRLPGVVAARLRDALTAALDEQEGGEVTPGG